MASTELSQILMDVSEINTDLLRLSKAMRNPAFHERFLNAVATDTSYFNEHDHRHVQDKFPKADPLLLNKLAKAVSRRRQFFRYREQYQSKLKQGLLTDHDDTSTVASSLPSQLKLSTWWTRNPTPDVPKHPLQLRQKTHLALTFHHWLQNT